MRCHVQCTQCDSVNRGLTFVRLSNTGHDKIINTDRIKERDIFLKCFWWMKINVIIQNDELQIPGFCYTFPFLYLETIFKCISLCQKSTYSIISKTKNKYSVGSSPIIKSVCLFVCLFVCVLFNLIFTKVMDTDDLFQQWSEWDPTCTCMFMKTLKSLLR